MSSQGLKPAEQKRIEAAIAAEDEDSPYTGEAGERPRFDEEEKENLRLLRQVLSRKVVRSFARRTNPRDTYGVDGIFAGDIALVTHFIVPKGDIFAKLAKKLPEEIPARRRHFHRCPNHIAR